MKSRKIVSALVAFAVAGITTFGAPNTVQAAEVLVNVPNDAFETKLISLGYDTGALDNYVPLANVRGLTSLDLSNTQITDYKGLADFTSLTALNISGNTTATSLIYDMGNFNDTLPLPRSIRTINLSGATSLTTLTIAGYEYSKLDLTGVTLTGNTALTSLSIQNTALSALDVSSLTALTSLIVSNTALSSIDVSAL